MKVVKGLIEAFWWAVFGAWLMYMWNAHMTCVSFISTNTCFWHR